MSEFSVQLQALDGLADLLDRAGTAAGGCRIHLFPVETLDGGEGVLDEAAHAGAMSGLLSWLRTFGEDALVSSGTAVRNARTYYAETDADVAAEFDETAFHDDVYVGDVREALGRAEIEPPEGTGRFDDVVDAADSLYPALDKDALEMADMGSIAWFEAFSISAWMNETFTQASQVLATLGLIDRAYNPLEELFRPWVGDWAGVRATALGLDDVATAMRRMNVNLRWAADGCDEVWNGNAGDAATVWLMLAAERPYELEANLRGLSESYDALADEMIEHRDALTSLYKTVIDLCVEIAAAGAVAGGTTATGVGAPVGGLAALYMAYKATRFVDTVGQLFDTINLLNTAVATWRGALGDFSVDGIRLPVLPAQPIQGPADRQGAGAGR